MFRLTALLIAALIVVFMVAGRTPGTPQIGLVSQRPVAPRLAPTAASYTPASTVATQTPRQQALATVPAPAPETVILTASAVNLRAGPSTATAPLGRLTRGTTAIVIARVNSWAHIRTKGGLDGYVLETFLKPAP
jgi:SH3-like domain-containing protein